MHMHMLVYLAYIRKWISIYKKRRAYKLRQLGMYFRIPQIHFILHICMRQNGKRVHTDLYDVYYWPINMLMFTLNDIETNFDVQVLVGCCCATLTACAYIELEDGIGESGSWLSITKCNNTDSSGIRTRGLGGFNSLSKNEATPLPPQPTQLRRRVTI